MIYGTHIFDEMKEYVGLTEEDDVRLAEFGERLGDRGESVVEHFYERILSTESARDVLQDDEQVGRLKISLSRWLMELLSGPRDADYYERRRRIGHKHVDVSLPSRFMFTSMSVVYQDLICIAKELYEGQALVDLCISLRRATDLDLAVMTGTYIEGRELRQLANLQDVILTHLPIAAIIADADDIVTLATAPASALLGRRSVVGKKWKHAFPPALLEAADLQVEVEAAVAQARQCVLPRIKVRIGGRRRYIRVTIVPLDHAQARLLIHLEDLSNAIDAEARLQRSEALAQIGALSAAVAHELRNPLAGMSGALQVIRRSFEDADPRKRILGKVDEQIDRLNLLVTELLTFARPIEPTLEMVNLRDIVVSALDLVRTSRPQLKITVDGDGRALADRALTHQVMLNLIQNAAHAADQDGLVHLQISGTSIRVEDSGPGVPAEIRTKIFEPFFTTRTRGTGLGLAICQKAARSMNAELALVGARTLPGAAFVLRLPPEEG